MRKRTLRVPILAVLLAALSMLAFACGGGDDSAELGCEVKNSEFGPLQVQLGMSEEAAEQFMIDNGIDKWIEVSASGDWQPLWDLAYDRVGGQIHLDISWIDVEVELEGEGDLPDLVPVRVSRSYQGKIEAAQIPAFEPVSADADPTGCTVKTVLLGDEDHPLWLDLTAEASAA